MVIVQSIHQKAWHNTLKVAQNSSLKDDELETEKFGVRVIELTPCTITRTPNYAINVKN